MKIFLIKHLIYVFISLISVTSVFAQSDDRVESIVNNAIMHAGGADVWHDNGTLIVHEFQKRYEERGVVIVDLTHTMNTDGSGYRIELAREGSNFVYGWDGNEFWAMADGKSGTDDDVREARRVISNTYFRFSLPFVLEKDIDELESSGTDSLHGIKTEVLKITYNDDPAERYFSRQTGGHGDHSGNAEAVDSSGDDHASGSDHQAQSDHGGGHHGGEVYFFHFAENGQLKKVYFSHHGDDTYETLLYANEKMVSGINREHKWTLYRPDGKIHYESFFSKIEFSDNVNAEVYESP